MSVVRTAAEREEEAQLNELRGEADRTAAEAARTLAELSRRIAAVRRPGQAARRLAADARVTALRVVREGPGSTAGQRGAWRPALAAIPVLVVAAALAYAAARGQLAAGKRATAHPERARASARHRPSRCGAVSGRGRLLPRARSTSGAVSGRGRVGHAPVRYTRDLPSHRRVAIHMEP